MTERISPEEREETTSGEGGCYQTQHKHLGGNQEDFTSGNESATCDCCTRNRTSGGTWGLTDHEWQGMGPQSNAACPGRRENENRRNKKLCMKF